MRLVVKKRLFIINACLMVSCHSLQYTTEKNNNNLITVKQENTLSNEQSDHDEVIFEGSNNLIALVQVNASYFDQVHDVIIIKGKGNIISLYNTNILDLRTKNTDSLIIIGNKQKYILHAGNLIATDKTLVPDTIKLKEQFFNPAKYIHDVRNTETEEEKITLYYFEEKVTPQFAIDFLTKGAQDGKMDCLHELAELYLYGIGVEASTTKAIELLEFAAAKDYIPSIRRLAEIHSGAPKNPELSQYYLKRGSMLGDANCQEQLKKK